jgi:hypothetical protein
MPQWTRMRVPEMPWLHTGAFLCFVYPAHALLHTFTRRIISNGNRVAVGYTRMNA